MTDLPIMKSTSCALNPQRFVWTRAWIEQVASNHPSIGQGIAILKKGIVPPVGLIFRHGGHVGMDNDDIFVGELVPAVLKCALRPFSIDVLPREKLESAPMRLIETKLGPHLGWLCIVEIWANNHGG